MPPTTSEPTRRRRRPEPAAEGEPDTGRLVAYPVVDRRKFIKQMVETGSTAEYAASKWDSMHEKELEHGVVHVDPLTRYVTRVKPADAGEAEERAGESA